jgi:hypothetical protein
MDMRDDINESNNSNVKEMSAKIFIVDAAKSDMDMNCYSAELSRFDIKK